MKKKFSFNKGFMGFLEILGYCYLCGIVIGTATEVVSAVARKLRNREVTKFADSISTETNFKEVED